MKKINNNLAVLLFTIIIWFSFLSIQWKFILSTGSFAYLYVSWDIFVVEKASKNIRLQQGNFR